MTAETTTNTQSAPAETSKVNTSDANLLQVRRLLDQKIAENKELAAKAQKLEQEREQFARGTKSSKYEEDDDVSSEPYIDPKTLNRKLAALESKFESIVEKKSEEKARTMIEHEKRESYLKQNADFDHMMQPDMIQKFAEKFPGMAEAILRMPDSFDRQRLVYEAIKNTGVNKKEESKENIQATIDANKRKGFYAPGGVGAAPYAGGGDYSESGQKNAYAKLMELKSRLRLG